MKKRRRKIAAPRRSVTGDDIEWLTGRARSAVVKAGEEPSLAGRSAADQTRETAKEVFAHIKAAHARAEKDTA